MHHRHASPSLVLAPDATAPRAATSPAAPPQRPVIVAAAAPAPPPVRPGIGVTIYGDLPRDIDRARDVIRACDLVTLHTAADPTDTRNAALVRQINPDARVWLAIPANYLVRLATEKGIEAAAHEAERVARAALDMGAEVLEFNGEGQSDGKKPGDWIPENSAEAVRLARLAVALLEAARAVLGSRCALAWTSHDMPGFRLPWGEILSRVDIHAPQHYPAMEGRLATQRDLERRIATSQGRWEALAERGEVPASVVPHGAAWTPYLQAWGHTLGATVWGLCEAPVARLWAFPGSWDPRALTALRVARAIRAAAGYGPEAVETWQCARGLTVDGSVGPLTLASAGV